MRGGHRWLVKALVSSPLRVLLELKRCGDCIFVALIPGGADANTLESFGNGAGGARSRVAIEELLNDLGILRPCEVIADHGDDLGEHLHATAGIALFEALPIIGEEFPSGLAAIGVLAYGGKHEDDIAGAHFSRVKCVIEDHGQQIRRSELPHGSQETNPLLLKCFLSVQLNHGAEGDNLAVLGGRVVDSRPQIGAHEPYF